MFKVLTVVGTRPELIKLSLVIEELERSVKHCLVHTGQNYDYELNQVFFNELGIRAPDYFLECAGKTPTETIARVIERVDSVLEKEAPDAVLIYGDTNSCLAALSAKRRQIPIFHMEAGNRCFDLRVPEEINRKIVDHLSDVNMTLTEHARRYLLDEGLRPESTFKVGSSMPEIMARHADAIARSDVHKKLGIENGKYFVISAHREENLDDPKNFECLLESLKALGNTYKLPIIFSTHPRTRIKLETAGVDKIEGVTFMKPLGFFDYISLQKNAFCVISDSGTITEEASILKIPAITIRNAHERPEGMDAGVLVMSGLNPDRVLAAVKLVTDQAAKGYNCDDVADYMVPQVSKTVTRIIVSYIDYVRRTVWSDR